MSGPRNGRLIIMLLLLMVIGVLIGLIVGQLAMTPH